MSAERRARWSFGLIRDTGAILLDMNPDRHMADNLKRSIESEGDQLVDPMFRMIQNERKFQ
ncbi:hypothetical protein [Bradyrhizobium sp. BR13661]|uniref:hypothetical protein n=1 Tax=Bradyrhizobium sp. BR13661 TaxID=2940622 RepID=UPI002475D169|nr:hypothetical protein [Bradyrhizobium sp. BR13661]MDH6259121.1 Co/Zn/Cd efflux system component [Bradyrhizobium sp. BR13661]